MEQRLLYRVLPPGAEKTANLFYPSVEKSAISASREKIEKLQQDLAACYKQEAVLNDTLDRQTIGRHLPGGSEWESYIGLLKLHLMKCQGAIHILLGEIVRQEQNIASIHASYMHN